MTNILDENRQQREEIQQLRDEMTRLTNENRQQHDDIDRLNTLCETKQAVPSTNTIQDPAHACVGESVTLQCTAPYTITVLRGEYGRYADDCVSGCCEPNGTDCTELMAEVNTEKWQNIKTSWSDNVRVSLHRPSNRRL